MRKLKKLLKHLEAKMMNEETLKSRQDHRDAGYL
jgi:hypothetical protein